MGKEYRLTTGNTSVDVSIFTGNILGYGLWREVRIRASEKDWLSFVLWEERASPAFCHSCEPNSEASHGNYWNAYPNCKFVARKKNDSHTTLYSEVSLLFITNPDAILLLLWEKCNRNKEGFRLQKSKLSSIRKTVNQALDRNTYCPDSPFSPWWNHLNACTFQAGGCI